MQDLRVTFVQADLFWEDIPKNLARFDERLASYGGQQDLIVLPEMFNTGFTVVPDKIAEKSGGPTLSWLSAKAREMNAVITGSYVVREGLSFYNRLIWMQPDGHFESYDKRHLFRMAGEHNRFSGGSSKLVVDLLGWKICPLICYDLRFPVWSKNLYFGGQFQYDLLLYVANWPEVRSHAWKTLLMARAMENLSYVIGVNRVGLDGNGIRHSGDSAALDFAGSMIQHIPAHSEGEATVLLSASALHDYRSKFNAGPDWDEFEITL